MKEVKVGRKQHQNLDYRDTDQLIEEQEYVGIEDRQQRRYLFITGGSCTGYAVNASRFIDKDFLASWAIEDFRFFVFDSANELYRWMIEGE